MRRCTGRGGSRRAPDRCAARANTCWLRRRRGAARAGARARQRRRGRCIYSQSASGSRDPAAASASGVGRSSGARPLTGTPVRASIVSRLERSIALGAAGQGVSTIPRTSSPAPRAASTVSRVWLIVPEARAGGEHHRQAELPRQISDVEALAERDEQSPDALDDRQPSPGSLADRGHERLGVDRPPGQLGGQMRRHRRIEARDRHRLARAACGPGQQLVVGRPRRVAAAPPGR